jgi:hypothetical protein
MAGVFVWVAMSGNWDSRADLFPVIFSCAREGGSSIGGQPHQLPAQSRAHYGI